MASHAVATTDSRSWKRVGTFLLHEFRELIPPTLFFFIGFNLILFTKRLMLEDYLIQFYGFLIATTGALIVGKVVLVADAMPFLRRLDGKPLIYPILFKTVVYTMLVLVARLLEEFIRYVVGGGGVGGGGFVQNVLDKYSWHRFTAVQLWIFVLFLLYATANELNELFGDGELHKIFFTRRSTELKSTRRARIRLLTRLSRLTSANSLAVLENPGSDAHRELVDILRNLSGRQDMSRQGEPVR